MQQSIQTNATTHENPPPHSPCAEAVPFKAALWFWFRLGWISFGGPAGQIALMHSELVQRRRWIGEGRFVHALNFCMVLPGPEAQQLATYLGWLMHRTWGGLLAGGLFVLPSLLLMMGLGWVYCVLGKLPLVAGLLYGVKPAVVAIVVQAVHRLATRVLRHRLWWAVAVLAFLAMTVGQVAFPWIVVTAALLGAVVARYWPQGFDQALGPTMVPQHEVSASIDDQADLPPHAQFRWPRLLATLAVGFLLWALPMAALTVGFGWLHPLTQMGWFFTKAALLTFGGAYAVLPYVHQGAVLTHGWVTPAQMMDGLALGETTPGPLIMVVVFVAFLGGFAQAVPMLGGATASGVLAALLVAWFTFLPSFVLILAGGPLVESTRTQVNFTAALTAISAAVVGVMLNLAVFFGQHVFWPQGMDRPVDGWALGLFGLALLALLGLKRSVMQVVAGGAALGVLLGWLGLV